MGLAVVRRIPPYKIALSSWERASRALPSHALKHNDMIASGPPGVPGSTAPGTGRKAIIIDR